MDIGGEVVVYAKPTELEKIHDLVAREFSVVTAVWAIAGIRIINVFSNDHF
jgi:hypothetical protein